MNDTATYIRRDLLTTELDGELVIFDEEQGKYFTLQSHGLAIWRAIAEPCSAQKVMLALRLEYDLSDKNCIQDIEFFLSELVSKGLVRKV